MGRQRSSTIVNPMSVAHLHCRLQVKLKLGGNRSFSLGETRSGQRGGGGMRTLLRGHFMCDRFDRARFEKGKGKGKFSMNSTETRFHLQ
jgi:hypothetical protein